MDRSELSAAVQPEAVKAALAANAEHLRTMHDAHAGTGMASVRTVTHKGRVIVIRTSYEITVDGKPFDAHVIVDNRGRVHYHGLPTRDFPSTVDLVKKAIDSFPDDFPAGGTPAQPGQSPEHSHHEHGTSGGH